MKNYEKLAFASIGIIRTISIVTAPFVKLLTFSTNIISKLFGVGDTDEQTVTEEEIRMMVDVGEEKGIIEKEEREMINNVFEFNDTVVSEIMVPRTEIYAVDMNLSISKVIEEITNDDDFRYSRIPVYEETIDDIKGIVYIKDILLSTKNKNVKIKNLVKEAYYVPETKPLNELFNELRKNRKQIAIVVDEYGGTAGVVTMEDILEEIVGEIYDEYDEVEKIYEIIDELNFRLSGSMSIYDVEKVLDTQIPEGDYDTLSGYLVEVLGRIPTEKDKAVIETPGVIYKLEKVEDMRIVRVKATKVVVEEPEDEDYTLSEDVALQISSIILAAVLLLVLIIVFARNIIKKKNRKERKIKSFYDRNTRDKAMKKIADKKRNISVDLDEEVGEYDYDEAQNIGNEEIKEEIVEEVIEEVVDGEDLQQIEEVEENNPSNE